MASRTSFSKKSDPKSAPNSNFLWMQCYLLNLVWVGIVPNTAILLVNIAIHPKMRFVTKDDFSAKIRVLFQTLRNPVSKQSALSMVINFELLGQLAKFAKLKTVKDPSSCARRGIDCLGFSCTLSRTAAIFWTDLAFL
ncbi:Hypothetical protein CINCED_3A008449 [Cinara cedri]|uniref:Uncharacterized protein n=1 Tax=Cinara cedri TaxID=506608 RepID=A0A5E4N4Z5_9HEMI|nr:Hypothetical protein CINCED_3A008449 [Cinara cedri]